MKKVIMLMAVTSMILTIIACSNNATIKPNPKNPVILNLMTYYNDIQLEGLKAKVSEFNETVGVKKGIIVEVKSVGGIHKINDALIKLADDISGNEDFPDMFITCKEIVPYLVGKIELVDYNDYFTIEELSKFNNELIEIGKLGQNEELLMMPIGSSTDVLYVNKTDFALLKYSLNITYDDLSTYEGIVEAAEKYYEYTDSLTDAPNDGKALFSADSLAEQFLSVCSAMGEDFIQIRNSEVLISFEHDIARKIWNIYYVPFIKGHFERHGVYASEDIKTGRTLLVLASTSAAAYMPEKIMEKNGYIRNIDMDVLQGPHLRDYAKVSVHDGGGIFIGKSTQIREYGSMEFVKWFTDKNNNIDFAFNTSYMPVRKDNVDSKYIEKKGEKEHINSVVVESLITSLEQKNNSTSYMPPEIYMYEDIRNVIERILTKDTKEKRKNFLEELQRGKNYDELVAEYLSDREFEEWRTNIIKQVEIEIKSYRNRYF